jgi:uncharacterized protein (DUF983 family)
MTLPTEIAPVTLPHSYPEAAMRGMRGRCPRCGEARLFRKWLKPVDRCPACGQDWSLQRADDFPPYVSILLTGHLMAPLIILLALEFDLSAPASLAIVLPIAIVVMLGVLQPAKGAIIALQWWLGLVGFRKERPPAGVAGSP